VKVIGGGGLLEGPSAFDIGKSNTDVLIPMFTKAGVTVSAWEIGGTASRTVEVQVATGAAHVRSRGIEIIL
jgi:chemotaxis receptor (MCP) glutamine deamidase CheD